MGEKVSLYKTLHGVVAAASLVLAPFSANAECFTQKEWEAAHVRVLQTTLEVAALECANVKGSNYDAQYKQFISRFTPQLIQNGTLLKAHFHRVYGKSGETYLDRFATRLANNASTQSMNSMTFCADSAAMFKTALAIDQSQLPQIAVQTVTDHEQIGALCTTASTKKSKKPVGVPGGRLPGGGRP
jgi:hypothetical protein